MTFEERTRSRARALADPQCRCDVRGICGDEEWCGDDATAPAWLHEQPSEAPAGRRVALFYVAYVAILVGLVWLAVRHIISVAPHIP